MNSKTRKDLILAVRRYREQFEALKACINDGERRGTMDHRRLDDGLHGCKSAIVEAALRYVTAGEHD